MCMSRTFTLIVGLVLVARNLARTAHEEPVPLLGYSCKNNAQRPCELCEEGYYCDGKYSKHRCGGPDVFCPLGSYKPTLVERGYYSIGGSNETRFGKNICSPGSFCINGVKRSCPPGYYCPEEGMFEPLKCGEMSLFCPEGSISPKIVNPGYYSIGESTDGNGATQSGQRISPVGYYAIDGVLRECPEGYYGSKEGLFDTNCEGMCEAGWYCPRGSVSPKQNACGSTELFCPKGSATPQRVQTGYHTSTESEPCMPGRYRIKSSNVDVSISAIATSRDSGKCVPCPDGTFKHIPGDDISLCQKCGPIAKSTDQRVTCDCFQSATEKRTKELYFDVFTLHCIDIAGRGKPPDEHYPANSQLTKSNEFICEPGYFCYKGVRYKCPAGRYGDKYSETSSECSGPCQEGHWCGEASTKATQNPCGGPNLFCPPQSAAPKYVSMGFYLDEDEPHDKKTSQRLCPRGSYCPGNGLRYLCPKGMYGSESGLSTDDCNGHCDAGYYCPEGSVSSRQTPCGNSTVYCPHRSSLPVLVEKGYYSSSSIGIINEAGPNATHDMQIECEPGYYCVDGIKYSCPGGTFGEFSAASDLSDCKPCQEGFFCPSYPGPPSTTADQAACGESYLYCPSGSSKPLPIEVGHYGTGGEFAAEIGNDPTSFRTSQAICPPGFYCQSGLKHKCPAGTFGETEGLVETHCSGLCPRGFFCPENCVKPLPCSPGSYSTGGAAECTSCEIPLTVSMQSKNSMCSEF